MLYTPKHRIGDDRDEQKRIVDEICARMGTRKVTKAARTRMVWNECQQRYVEMR